MRTTKVVVLPYDSAWKAAFEEIRKEMGKKARKSAMRYAPENIMPLWDKLFNEIVNQ